MKKTVKIKGLEKVKKWPDIQANDQEKSIALKWFQSAEKHECSWDGKKYTEKRIDDLFFDALTVTEQQAPFAYMLMMFSNWGNDLQDICNQALGYEYQWPNLQKKRKEWDKEG
jgi:hypothetical protein